MNRNAQLVLAFLFATAMPLCLAETPKPAGGMPATEASHVEVFKQEKHVLTPAERDGVVKLGRDSARIVQRYLPRIKANRITARTLDRAYDAWVKDGRAGKPAAEQVIPAFGVRLGMLALHSCKGTWYHVKDHYGEALAIEFTKTGRRIYPIDSVNKRYEQHTQGFFAKLHKVYLLACQGQMK